MGGAATPLFSAHPVCKTFILCALSVIGYLFGKILDGDHKDFRPINFFQDVEMGVVGDDVHCVGGNGTVDKLVVIKVLLDKAKMVIGILKQSGVEPGDGLDNIVSNLLCGLSGQYLLVFV